MSLYISNPQNVDYSESEVKVLDFKTKAVSWYTTRDAVRTEAGFCGQDESALRFLHMPDSLKVNFDLNRTHPNDHLQLYKYSDNQDISDMLSWVKEIGIQEDSFSKTEFVCVRHELVDLMLMPYSSIRFNKGLKMYLTKANGKIYIRRMASSHDKKHNDEVLMSEFDKQRTKHGLIFQHYMISESPTVAPFPEEPFIRGDKSTFIVFEGTLGEHKLLYTSKIKALDKPEDIMNLECATFSDVRTNMGRSSKEIKWRKWMEWWGNCITGKVERVVVGFVGKKGPYLGNVKNLEVLQADKMISKCQAAYKVDRQRASEVMPEGHFCLNTLEKLLTFFKRELEGAKANEVYEFEYEPSETEVATLRLMGKSNEDDIFVIPKWYKEWLDCQG